MRSGSGLLFGTYHLFILSDITWQSSRGLNDGSHEKTGSSASHLENEMISFICINMDDMHWDELCTYKGANIFHT